MRLEFSVIGPLVAAFVILNLANKQAQVLVPAAASRAGATAPAKSPTPTQPLQQDLGRTREQGLQQRASEPGQ